MGRHLGWILLVGLASGCANRLIPGDPLARNTIPPPTTQNRAAGNGSGYYNPLSFFQPNGAGNTSGGFTPPFANPAPTGNIAANNSETASPFWNLPSAASNTRTNPPPVNDRWATNGRTDPGRGPNNFNSNNSYTSVTAPDGRPQIPPRDDFNRGAPNGNNSFGNNGFGNNGFNNTNGVANNGLGANTYGNTNNTFPSTGYGNASNNQLGNFFGGVMNSLGLGNNRNGPQFNPFGNAQTNGAQTYGAQPQQQAGTGPPQPYGTPAIPTPRFDFGAPKSNGSGAGGEPPIRISDPSLREIPRNARDAAPTTNLTRGNTPAPNRPASMPLNPLPAGPSAPTSQSGDYIEISRLPASRSPT